MKRHCALGVAAFAWLAASVLGQRASESPIPSDSEIRRILAERIDAQRQSVGIVVGVIDRGGRRIIAHGSTGGSNSGPALDGGTVFEIGSITKVFTALLAADMVVRGEAAWSDPLAKYLPEGTKVPERGRAITLEDLATHTSGLPRLPSNSQPRDAANPYADYTVEQLYGFLAGHDLGRDAGTQYEYSNLGAGLLGHVLARRAGSDYESLVRSRICEPLGMKSTGIALPPAMTARLAPGHNPGLARVSNWDIPTFAGAGALRSSGDDMLAFLAAVLGYTDSPLRAAMEALLAVRRPTPAPGMEIALGWHVRKRGDKEIVWHNGGTGGYRSFLGFDAKTRAGVVVLSNTFTPSGVDDIGEHLLDRQAPLLAAPKQRQEIRVDPKLYDGYTGRYELAPNFILTVTREGDRLFVQATGQGKAEVFPESERDYFYKVADAQITFETGEDGRATGLILHQNGRDMPAKRTE